MSIHNPIRSIPSRGRLVILFAILLTIGFLGWRALRAEQQTVRYQTTTAEKGTLVTAVSASGTVSSGNTVAVSTETGGVVGQVYVKNGDTVTQGQKIAEITLDSTSQQKAASAWSTYLTAQSAVSTSHQNKLTIEQSILQDQTNLLTAQINARGTDGWDPTSPEKQKVDNARRAAELALQANRMKLSNADLQIAKSQSDFTSAWLAYQAVSGIIVAPVSGKINNLVIIQGLPISSPANASSGSTSASSQKIATITLPDRGIQAVANLSETDVAKIKPGQKAVLTFDSLSEKTFTGKVAFVNTDGEINSGVTNYPATIILDTNKENIYPNMSVTAKIITNVKSDVTLVPSSAVQTVNGRSTARVLKNGEAVSVPVEVGDSNDTQTEVVSGINEGDTVITGSLTPQTGTGSQGTTSPFGGFGGRGSFGGPGGGGVFIRR